MPRFYTLKPVVWHFTGVCGAPSAVRGRSKIPTYNGKASIVKTPTGVLFQSVRNEGPLL